MDLPVVYDDIPIKERRLVREEYIRLQNGKCFHCGNLLDSDPSSYVLSKPLNMKLFPPKFLSYPVHLHHSHDTGLTIGAVHAYCNGVMWQYNGE